MVATTSHIFSGKVDIASNLQVGSSHLFVDTENNRVGITTASPDATLHVNGNVYATRFEGDGSLLTGIASNLEQITNNGNVTSNAVQFTNPDTGIITTGNVNVGNKLSVASLTPGSVPYIDGDNTLTDSHITQGTDKVSITSNLEITGNILMSGETYKIDSQSLEVKDRIVGIAYDNTLSGADTGILMEYPTKNIGLIHHGASGNPYAQEFTIGYTQNTATDTTILNDPANKITVNVLGDLHTQNNMTVDSGGSYFGDGTTLTGVALKTDMTSNAARIANIETVNGTQTGLITGLRADMTSNASRITTLETANTVQAGLITSIKSDVTSNTTRISTLEAANTVQAGLITAIEADVTDNAARITTLEAANTVQAGLITAIEADVTDNAARITTLEAANTVQAGLITAIETDVTDNAARITTLEAANTVQAGLITAIETDITGNATRITTLEAANTVQAGLITAIETDVADNAARITNLDTDLSDNASRVTVLEATDAVYAGLLSGLRTDLDDTFITKTSDSTIISSNLEVTGNIFMRGDRFVVESETTLINDAIIGLANNNTVSTTDVGILMQRPTANVALVHHGGTDTFTIGYTQDTLEATDITNDTVNEINVNVLGQLHVQNNMTVGAGGSYYGDGSTLTGVALVSDATSNVTRIANLETANTVQGVLITDLTNDLSDNAARITTLEAANTVQAGLITAIEADVTDNTARITTLESANTVQAGLITTLTNDLSDNAARVSTLETDMTSNATRISSLEDANTVQGGLITAIETDVTSNATRITNLEASNTDIWSNLELLTLDDVVNVNNATSNTVQFTNTDTSLVASGNVTVSGNVTSTTALISNAVTIGTPKEFIVEVYGGFYFDGDNLPSLELYQGQTYIFDQSHSSNGSHPLAFATVYRLPFPIGSDLYTTGITSVGTPGNAGAKTTFVVPLNAPSSIYYYCTTHGSSLGSSTPSSILSTAELFVSGRIVASTFKGDGTTLTGVALKTDLASNVTRIAALETSNLTYTPLITGLRTDMTSNSGRIDALEPRVTNLEASNVDIWSNLALLTLDDVVNVNNATSNTVRFTNATTSLTASGNVTVSGNVTSTTALISNAVTMGTTKTFVVKVGANGKYHIDDDDRPSLELHQHQTYIFDMSDGSNSGHPLAFSTAFNGSSSSYSTGVVSNHGTVPSGTAGSKVTFTVPAGAPTAIFYYCTVHGAGMGSSTASSIASTAELIVSGRVVASGNVEASSFKGDGSQLTNIASNLQAITDNGNVTSNTVQFTNTGTSLVASGTVEAVSFVGSGAQLTDIASNLEQIVNNGNVTSNTILLTDATTGLVATGNVEALKFIGDGSELTNIASNLEQIANNGNVTSNTILLTDATTGLVATGNVHALKFIGDGSALSNLPTAGVWQQKGDGEIYYTASNVGISNADPGHNLSVGSNLYVDDDGSNVLVVTGNVKADYFSGDGSLLTNLPSGSGGVWSTNGDGEIYFINSNVGISNADPGHNLSVGSNLYVDDDGSNVLVVTGNVKADYFSGDGSLLTNLPSGSGGVWSTNGDGEIYFINSNVGISNADPGHNLSVGSNLYVDDDGSNVLVIDGNLTAESMTLGGIGIVPSYPLSSVTDTGNTTPHTIEFTNAETGLVVDSNIVVAGNVTAAFLYGDASNVTGIASNLHQIVENGNVTSNTVQFSNATTGLVTTANVEVGGDLAVTGNVSDLNIVSNVNMLHTSNTASIKLNSNVVTEFPRSKKLIKYPRVVLTANGLNQGYTVSGSSEYSSGLTYYGAFTPPTTLSTPSGAWLTPTSGTTGYDTGTGDYLLSAQLHSDSLTGEYVQIVLPERINPVYFTVQPRPESANNNQGLLSCIKEGEIWASNSNDGGTTWTLVGTIQNFIPTSLYQQYTVSAINATGYYDTFALIIHKNNGQVFAGVGEWQLYGVPEYDPEADGVDVVVKSLPNVPNTDWLEVYYDAKDLVDGSTTVNDLKPVGTAINGTVAGNTNVTDGAFTFDGSGDYIESLNITSLSENQILSTSVWVKFNSWTNANVDLVFSLGDRTGGTGKEYGLAAYHSGTAAPTTGLYVSIYGYDSIKSEVIPDLNKWYHFVTTHDGSTHQIFINGVLVKSGVTGGNVNLPTSGCDLVLGGDTSASRSQFMNGKIANFRLFNRALTSDEIYQLYAYQKEDFGHGDLGMTLKAGRLGIGTSEPRAALDVYGELYGPRTKPCFSIHTDDYWGADDNSWGSASGTHWSTLYKTPIPCVRRGWLEYDTHNTISFIDAIRGSNTGTIVKFTAPRSGFYHFSFNIGFKTGVAGDYLAFMLNKNQEDSVNGPEPNDYFLGVIHDTVVAKAYTLSASVNIYLNAGEFVVPYSRSAQNIYICNGGGFNFSGFYIG